MTDITNVESAEENENLANSLDPDQGDHRNWIVTIRFYSYLHYVEARLQAEQYDSESHKERMENIERYSHLDDHLYNIYRALYDISRDSRYECIRMGQNEVERSEEKLERGKGLLGFTGSPGTTHKYSTD